MLSQLYHQWAVPEKIQMGGGWVRIWNFQGYLRNSMWKFQGSIKREVEFPGAIMKKYGEISMGLAFWPWGVKGSNTVLQNFQDEAFFPPEYPWVK